MFNWHFSWIIRKFKYAVKGLSAVLSVWDVSITVESCFHGFWEVEDSLTIRLVILLVDFCEVFVKDPKSFILKNSVCSSSWNFCLLSYESLHRPISCIYDACRDPTAIKFISCSILGLTSGIAIRVSRYRRKSTFGNNQRPYLSNFSNHTLGRTCWVEGKAWRGAETSVMKVHRGTFYRLIPAGPFARLPSEVLLTLEQYWERLDLFPSPD